MKKLIKLILIAVLCVVSNAVAEPNLSALIIDGQNNHNWRPCTPVLQRYLDDTGLFKVDVATSPESGQPMDGFKPDFASYDVIVSNYNGDAWPEQTRMAFEDYMQHGGGLVVIHAADNPFPDWPAFNEMIGLGGWGGRDETSGPYVYYQDGELVRDTSPGPGGSHGPPTEYQVHHIVTDHPITRGLPAKWMHCRDELYSRLRGPAKNMTVLATAYADPEKNGTGRDEPVLMVINYGDGRVFHTVMGHSVVEMTCAGFITTFQRGAEWAATGAVTQTTVPADFPSPDQSSLRKIPGVDPDAPPPKSDHPLLNYDFGKSRAAMAKLEEQIRLADPALQRDIEHSLLGVLATQNISFPVKQFTCRMLRRVGTEESVPALNKLLTDKELSHMARFALQGIDSPMADEALRLALSQTDGDLRIGIISSIGFRKDRGAVDALAELLENSDNQLTSAILCALGQIGGEQAAEILRELSVPENLEVERDDAYLKCADSLLNEGKIEKAEAIYAEMTKPQHPVMIRTAGYQGLIASQGENAIPLVLSILDEPARELQQIAARAIAEMPGSQATLVFAKRLKSANPQQQTVLINALGVRNDAAALPYVEQVAQSDVIQVRRACAKALGRLGNANTVPLLLELSAEAGDLGGLAGHSLFLLQGDAVNDAVIDELKNKNPVMRVRAIDVIEARTAVEALPALLAATNDDDRPVRKAAYKALGALGTESQLTDLLNHLLATESTSEAKDIERALTAIIRRTEEVDATPFLAALEHADSGTRGRLFGILGAIGTSDYLAPIRTGLSDTDAELRKAAIRSLSDWPSATPLDDLLDVMQTSDNEVEQILALRGVVRLAPMARDRSPEDLERIFRAAMSSASRLEDKRLILSAIGDVDDVWPLEFLQGFLNEEELQEEVKAAGLSVMRHLNQRIHVQDETVLEAKDAVIHGEGARYEAEENRKCIGCWTDANTFITWDVVFMAPGTYRVVLEQALAHSPGSEYVVKIGDHALKGTTKETGDWGAFVPVDLGVIELSRPTTCTVAITPTNQASKYIINVGNVTITKQ